MSLNEKISIEEVIDEEWENFCEDQWVKYTASLCRDCGAEPGEPCCETETDKEV